MRKTVFSLINYIGCIGMALFVTFVIDGTIGMVLTYALIIAPVVSLAVTLAVIRGITVQPALSRSAVSKGDKLFCEIKLINSTILPAPLITAQVKPSAHFSSEGTDTLQGSVTGKGVNTLSFPITAVHSGKAHFIIDSVTVSDYLGIFYFRLKLSKELSDLTASVYPDIPEVSLQAVFTKTVSQFSANDDDEEESDDVSAVPTGLAGYDHRKYVPGDPIKRINWKLSSKRDILMVRLDEKIKGSGRTFLLDCPVTAQTDAALTVRDNVIEGALAMLSSLTAEGRDAVFWFCKQGLWMSAEMHNPTDIYALQEELADFEPCECPQLFPAELNSVSTLPICFTAAVNSDFSTLEALVAAHPDTMIISSYAASLPPLSSNQWVLSDAFELSRS
jgi:uncharacterized protein (DUF58 family)